MLAATAPIMAADSDMTDEQIQSRFDVAFGLAVTSQYVSRGVPQSDGLAVQGYIEPSYGIFYIGVWASNVGPVIFNAPATLEVDLYAGVRPTFGNLTVDFGYAHYFYNNGFGNAGEFYLKPSYAFSDMFSAGAQVFYSVTANAFSYGEINATVSLPHNFAISAAVGTDFAGNTNWNAGASWTLKDTVTFDARVHGHTTAGTRIVGTVSVGSTLNTLLGR
ncbi:MAG: hypothetical protein JJ913_14710 [Rhizobiaceae bacterium]|nr:hypothetical protein [Rhizobiaceae bacterium]